MIFQIMQPSFLFLPEMVKMAALLKSMEDIFMNLNFAFACMIVVSFAIALGHA